MRSQNRVSTHHSRLSSLTGVLSRTEKGGELGNLNLILKEGMFLSLEKIFFTGDLTEDVIGTCQIRGDVKLKIMN